MFLFSIIHVFIYSWENKLKLENSFLLKGTWPHSCSLAHSTKGASRSFVIAPSAVPPHSHAPGQTGQRWRRARFCRLAPAEVTGAGRRKTRVGDEFCKPPASRPIGGRLAAPTVDGGETLWLPSLVSLPSCSPGHFTLLCARRVFFN